MSGENLRNELNKDAYNSIARVYAGDEPIEDDPVLRKQCRELFTNALKGKDCSQKTE